MNRAFTCSLPCCAPGHRWAGPPVIRRKLSREHLSAISAVSMTGELYLAAQDHSYKSADIISFLEQLLEEIEGGLLVIWDGSPVHRSRAVKEWLAQGEARRIQLEQLPGYAPELNPDEGVWRYLKRVELKNLVCADLEQLGREFWAAAGRLLTLSQPKGRGAPLLYQGSGLCLLTHSLISNSDSLCRIWSNSKSWPCGGFFHPGWGSQFS